MIEVWLPVPLPEFTDYYEVSDCGSVRSLDRVVHTTNQYGPCTKRLKGIPLRPGLNSGGYPTVVLHVDGNSKTVGVHVLVCGAFNGEAPSPDMEVAHWDDVKTHNDASNLFWATRSQNALDRVRNGIHNQARKDRVHSWAQVHS